MRMKKCHREIETSITILSSRQPMSLHTRGLLRMRTPVRPTRERVESTADSKPGTAASRKKSPLRGVSAKVTRASAAPATDGAHSSSPTKQYNRANYQGKDRPKSGGANVESAGRTENIKRSKKVGVEITTTRSPRRASGLITPPRPYSSDPRPIRSPGAARAKDRLDAMVREKELAYGQQGRPIKWADRGRKSSEPENGVQERCEQGGATPRGGSMKIVPRVAISRSPGLRQRPSIAWAHDKDTRVVEKVVERDDGGNRSSFLSQKAIMARLQEQAEGVTLLTPPGVPYGEEVGQGHRSRVMVREKDDEIGGDKELERELARVEASWRELQRQRVFRDIRSAQQEELVRLERDLRQDFEGRVAGLMAEKSQEMRRCHDFREDLQREMDALKGIMEMLDLRQIELGDAYDDCLQELRSSYRKELERAAIKLQKAEIGLRLEYDYDL